MRPSHPRCESPSRLRSVLILATWASCIVCSSSTVHLGASFCNLCHPFIHGLLRCPHLRGDTHTLHRRHCQGHYSFRLLDDLMTVHHLLLVISCSPRGCYSFSFYAQIQTPWQECDSTTQAFQVICSRSFDDTVRWFRGSRVRELHAFSFEIGSMEMWCLDMFGYVWICLVDFAEDPKLFRCEMLLWGHQWEAALCSMQRQVAFFLCNVCEHVSDRCLSYPFMKNVPLTPC